MRKLNKVGSVLVDELVAYHDLHVLQTNNVRVPIHVNAHESLVVEIYFFVRHEMFRIDFALLAHLYEIVVHDDEHA